MLAELASDESESSSSVGLIRGPAWRPRTSRRTPYREIGVRASLGRGGDSGTIVRGSLGRIGELALAQGLALRPRTNRRIALRAIGSRASLWRGGELPVGV
jgi:hypothetical protein